MEAEKKNKKINNKRAPNYTNFEKTLIVELVGQNIQVIENKQTDVVYSQYKEKAWVKLSEEFNTHNVSGTSPTWEQLKSCYENVKYSAKKHSASDKV